MLDKIKLLLPGQIGYGMMIEQDAGYIEPKDNKRFVAEMQKLNSGQPIIEEPLILYAVLQKCNVENRNGRIYPEEILKREAKKYEQAIKERRGIGVSDHPESSIITVDDVSHEIKDMWWDGNTLMGKIEIIMTPGFVNYGIASSKGDRIANLLRKGIRIGVSSRGVGSLEKKDGKNIVQPDFDLICWDVVTQPSTPGSYIFNTEEEARPFMESTVKKQNLIENKDLKDKLDSFLGIL